jgi:hypothetical protein
VSTAVGALIGSLFGGVGAVPGAEIGFEIGLMILEAYGLAELIEMVLSVAGSLVSQLGHFIGQVWDADGDPKKIDEAGRTLADALGILVSAVLLALAAYVMHKGAKALGKTRFAQTVGETRIAQWLADRGKASTLKGDKPAPKETAPKEPAPKEEVKGAKEEAGFVACFLAGTLVVTGGGAVPIESVRAGDKVWTRLPGLEPVRLQEVSNAFGGTAQRVRRVAVAGGAVFATRGHRFSVPGQGWIAARDLVPGTVLETADGTGAAVLGVEDVLQAVPQVTYNLTVPATSTYLIRVGDDDLLVHNGEAPKLPDFDRVLYWVFGNKATVRETDTDGKSMWRTESKADVDKMMEARVSGDKRPLDDPHAFFEPKQLEAAGIALPETAGQGTAVVDTGLSHHSARAAGNPDPSVPLDAEGRAKLQELLNSAGKPTVVKPKALKGTCG